jgi:serine/threonine-protein kinase
MSDTNPLPAPPAQAADLTGRLLSDFRILRRLGQGGMGQVYLAEQISLKRRVALKVLRPDLAGNETSLKRFRQEAESVARATHANIVQVYAIGEGDGIHYMALEYVEGVNLREYLDKKGPPPLALALNIMRQVAAALARAAELGIVHRDIKPENILLTRKGEVKVADFGLSRCFDDPQPLHLTQTGMAMGTPLYMSPEQVQGKPVDARTDLYSFGATCYHLLAGQPPFRGESPFDVAIKHVQAVPEPLPALRPDLPPELCAVVERLMAKNPDDRFQTGRDVLRELNRIRERLSGTMRLPTAEPNDVPPPASEPRADAARRAETAPTLLDCAPPPAARRYGLTAAVLLLGLCAGGTLAWGKHRRAQARLPHEPAAFAPLPMSAEEKFLQKEADLYAVPTGRGDQNHGLHAQLALGLFYLEHRRWQDANQLFTTLQRRPLYRELGEVGHAVVLAFQDQAEESVKVFQQFHGWLEKPAGRRPLKLQILNHPALRSWVARALDRDAANLAAAQVPFPAELERLRKPAPLVPRPAKGANP